MQGSAISVYADIEFCLQWHSRNRLWRVLIDWTRRRTGKILVQSARHHSLLLSLTLCEADAPFAQLFCLSFFGVIH